MSEIQLLVAHAVKVGLLVLMAGLLIRGRVRQCWVFPAYVLAILLGNTLSSLWPWHFYTASFWVAKQAVYDALKMLLALELAWRAFGAFPGAMRTARIAILVILAASTLTLALLTPPSSYATVWNWQPSVVTATLWLLTATALVVVWYQVPVHDWQRAIMLGLAPYLLVFVTTLGLLKRRGWDIHPQLGLVDSLAYLALVLFWAWAAWRRDSAVVTPAPATRVA
jgi:hypothetical protein